jgi:hypothetical protein
MLIFCYFCSVLERLRWINNCFDENFTSQFSYTFIFLYFLIFVILNFLNFRNLCLGKLTQFNFFHLTRKPFPRHNAPPIKICIIKHMVENHFCGSSLYISFYDIFLILTFHLIWKKKKEKLIRKRRVLYLIREDSLYYYYYFFLWKDFVWLFFQFKTWCGVFSLY